MARARARRELCLYNSSMALRAAATKNMALAAEPSAERPVRPAARPSRVILIRHGRPALPISPKAGHEGFRAYIGEYEEAGLDPASLPPAELADLVGGLDAVFTSDKTRAHESARVLAPAARVIADPLFMEAPLAAPRLPLLRMRVPKWAVVARVLWYMGFHPGIEPWASARARARKAAAILIARAEADGTAVLVGHGYFNFLIGRVLRAKGFRQTGRHRARFWNAVIYERERGQ
jgi:broad specificity phosphatase PhoE